VLVLLLLGLLAYWVFGGSALRHAGLLVTLFGAYRSLVGDLSGLLALSIGVGLWLFGHWHFALHHYRYKSTLARYIFKNILGPRLDPTRNWTVSRDRLRDP
jgi:hypothetical protein